MSIPDLWKMTPREIRAYLDYLNSDGEDDIDYDAQEG